MLTRAFSAALTLIAVLALAPSTAAAGGPDTRLKSGADLVPPASTGATAGSLRQIALGVQELPATGAVYNNLVAVNAYKTDVGRDPAIWAIFRDWLPKNAPNTRFPGNALLTGLYNRHIVPMINWAPNNPYHTDQNLVPYKLIAQGRFDPYIKKWANKAAAYGHPLIIRFAQEMDGKWMPWQVGKYGNTAARFMAAWDRIVTLFRSAGATNVKFFWSPFSPDASSAKFYPGDQYVDYVGFTGLNWADDLRPWRSMQALYAAPMKGLAQITTKKPVIVAEAGSINPSTGGRSKPSWIKTGYPAVYAAYPRLAAIVYFDVNIPGQADWRLKTPAAALTAYKTIVNDPRFQGQLQ